MKVVDYKVISVSLCIYTHVIMIESFREKGGGVRGEGYNKWSVSIYGQKIYIAVYTAEFKEALFVFLHAQNWIIN